MNNPRLMCVCWDFFADHFRRALCVLAGVPTGQAQFAWDVLPEESRAAIEQQIETMARAQENTAQKGRNTIGASGTDAHSRTRKAAGNGAGRLQIECEHCKEEGRSFCTCSPLRVTTAKASAMQPGRTPGTHHTDTR